MHGHPDEPLSENELLAAGWQRDEKGYFSFDTDKVRPQLGWEVRFGLARDDTRLFNSRNAANKWAREFGGRVCRVPRRKPY